MSTCSRCGASFVCAMEEGSAAPCWCAQLPPLLPLPQEAAARCWCPDCLRAALAAQQAQTPPAQG
ncbi:cysteine-rich CWC family protein [Massilia sp. TS11]|uniref:cysteine-rich CWC family protein n=1 Tax=Massilia sp. TS11 TaxID=2908003 RepID=UPI001EDC14F7|nr:cysteine-rich CWC family protein [Massilia sp. TS11]MCG2585258.1 cysteine-rich CWC family protein [Massilia sp. TS11]